MAVRFYFSPRKRARRIHEENARCIPFTLPQIAESFNQTIFIQSKIKSYRKYKINLFKRTCTCRRFKRHRRYYPMNDIQRLCRHQRRELIKSKAISHFDELTQAIILFKIRDRCYTRLTIDGDDIAIGYHPKNDFVRIFTRRLTEDDPEEGPATGAYD
ncbi:MAG: hypothetical protein HQL53_05265, partial [Magnetococcales bacterium]|nr:hypothetical protein [Magnetococcales bacterium]